MIYSYVKPIYNGIHAITAEKSHTTVGGSGPDDPVRRVNTILIKEASGNQTQTIAMTLEEAKKLAAAILECAQ